MRREGLLTAARACAQVESTRQQESPARMAKDKATQEELAAHRNPDGNGFSPALIDLAKSLPAAVAAELAELNERLKQISENVKSTGNHQSRLFEK